MKNLILGLLILICSMTMGQEGFSISEKAIEVDNLTYTFFQASPKSNNQAEFILIALHWGWDPSRHIPKSFAKNFLQSFYIPACENQNIIIAAPNCPAQNWYDTLSEKIILQITDTLLSQANNPNVKVAISGYSAGGYGVWNICSKYPEKFALAIPISSMPDNSWIEKWDKVPVYAIQSNQDELFKFNKLAKYISRLKERDVPVKLLKLDDYTHYDTGEFILYVSKAFKWYNRVGKK